MMDNLESQQMEILALQNIYEEKDFVVCGMNPPCGRIAANVRLPNTFFINTEEVRLQDNALNQPENASVLNEPFQVEYLPPITLFFEFSNSYPSHSLPAFLLSCNWLTLQQLTKLCKQLEVLWELSKDAILYTWIQFLQDEALDFLCVDQCLDITDLLQFRMKDNFLYRETLEQKEEENPCDPQESKRRNFKSSTLAHDIRPSIYGGSGVVDARAFNDLSEGKNLLLLLKDYNEYKKEDVFNMTVHNCDICCLTLIGSDFIVFKACMHAFCKNCLKSYFELQINEGNVNALNCPGDKCSTQADGSTVKQVVSEEVFEKYDRLLLSRTLEGMTDIAYCPRPDCRCPLLLETCGKMGSCTACSFVFCPFCKMAYHGVARCRFKSSEKQTICETYLEATPEEQAEIEKKYGKRLIKSIIEDALSEEWVESNSKNCPRCNVSIEKTDGCNKMTCYRCGSFFCWICVKELTPYNPYGHYSQRGTRCYNQLFPVTVNDEYDVGEFL